MWSGGKISVIMAALFHTMLLDVAKADEYAYIPNFGSNNVSVVNTVTEAVEASINVGEGPMGISAGPDGRIYVSNFTGDSVSVIDEDTRNVIETIPVGDGPAGIALSPSGNMLYVANFNSSNISAISVASDTVVDTIPLNAVSFPWGVAVSADGGMVYVTMLNSMQVYAVNVTTKYSEIINVGAGPRGIALSHDGNSLYVANQTSNTVSIVSTLTNTVTSTISAGNGPFGLFLSGDGGELYVANNGGGGDSYSVVDTATKAVQTVKNLGQFGPIGISLTYDSTKILVVNSISDTVSVFDAVTNAHIKNIQVGTFPTAFGVFMPPQLKPEVTSVSPSSGSTSGGTVVTIKGSGFASGAKVAIGGSECSQLTVISRYEIACTTVEHNAGIVNVIVTNKNQKIGIGEGLFSYDTPPLPPPPPIPNPIPTLSEWAKIVMALAMLAMMGWHVRKGRR